MTTHPLTQKDSSKEDAATQQIADEHSNDFIARLRQWQGFPLTEYQAKELRKSFLSSIERAREHSDEIDTSCTHPYPQMGCPDCGAWLPAAQPQPSKARKEQAPRAQGSPRKCTPVWGSCNLPAGHNGQHNAQAKWLPRCSKPAICSSAIDKTKGDK